MERGIAEPLRGQLGRAPGRWRTVGRFFRRKPLGAVGLGLLLASILVAILAPVLSPYDPYEPHREFGEAPPSSKFWLGTDYLGRDILSRIIYGARASLGVGFLTVILSSLLGSTLGIVSAYVGGSFDLGVQRLVDSLQAFPALVLAMMLTAVMGPSLTNVIIALAVVNVPRMTRTVRSVALTVKEMPYVEAARAVGAEDARIVFCHIFPNCVAPLLVLSSAILGWAITVEATLSFLGLGLPPNIPSWGGMLGRASQTYIAVAPWLAVFPGLALTLVVFGINVFGDALRDILDPKLRRG